MTLDYLEHSAGVILSPQNGFVEECTPNPMEHPRVLFIFMKGLAITVCLNKQCWVIPPFRSTIINKKDFPRNVKNNAIPFVARVSKIILQSESPRRFVEVYPEI